MKPETSTQSNRPVRIHLFCALAAMVMFIAACGPTIIEGRPPFINISGMALVDDRLSADFAISNQNGVPMSIRGIEIAVRVNDVELARENRDFSLDISANSTEEIQVEELPDEFTRDLLDSLGSGEVKSLPFDLEGRVETLEDGILAFSQKGHLYPVPGRPGQFRSTVTQSKGLRRDDDF